MKVLFISLLFMAQATPWTPYNTPPGQEKKIVPETSTYGLLFVPTLALSILALKRLNKKAAD